MPQQLQAPGLFSPDPSQVRDLSGLSMGDFFNQHVVPSIDALDRLAGVQESPVDLDNEDELATKRRQRQAQLDQQGGLFQEQQDQALFARRRAERGSSAPSGTPARTSGGSFDLPSRQEAPAGTAPTSSAPASNLTSFVKDFEGFSDKAFSDYKQTSIGYGTRARKGEKTITKAEAEKRLGEELNASRASVLSHVKKHNLKLNANQIDALTSFQYNTGRLNQLTAGGTRTPAQIAAKLPAYKKAGGKTLKGLVRRRKAEQQLFNSKP